MRSEYEFANKEHICLINIYENPIVSENVSNNLNKAK